jgi:site-specific recombinase XerD
MRGALDTIASILTTGQCDALALDWAALRYQHTAAVRAVLADGRYAPTTANRHLAALRGVLRECWRLGYVGVEDYHRAADLPAIRGSRLPRGRALQTGELKALFDGCANDGRAATATRDAALLALLYGSGLRRAEVVALDLADYDRQASSLKIHGKGNKQRLAYLAAGAQAALDDWLELRGDAPGPLFWPIHRSGRLGPLRRLSPQAVLYLVRRRADGADVSSFSPHDLRRSFISDLLDAGVDLSTVQQLVGHSQVQTTARYDRRGEVTKQRAATALHVPYGRRRGGASERRPPDAQPARGSPRA